jgi:hypothetical protein
MLIRAQAKSYLAVNRVASLSAGKYRLGMWSLCAHARNNFGLALFVGTVK